LQPLAGYIGRRSSNYKLCSCIEARSFARACTELYLQKLCTKLRKSSTKGFAAPLPTQYTGYAMNGVCSAQGGLRSLPLEALFEALLKALLEALLKAQYGGPKLY